MRASSVVLRDKRLGLLAVELPWAHSITVVGSRIFSSEHVARAIVEACLVHVSTKLIRALKVLLLSHHGAVTTTRLHGSRGHSHVHVIAVHRRHTTIHVRIHLRLSTLLRTRRLSHRFLNLLRLRQSLNKLRATQELNDLRVEHHSQLVRGRLSKAHAFEKVVLIEEGKLAVGRKLNVHLRIVL